MGSKYGCRVASATVLACLLWLVGCGSVVGSFGNHQIRGRGSYMSTLSIGADDAVVTLDGKRFVYREDKLTWDGGELSLPDSWHRLDLVACADGIRISTDGKLLTTVSK